MADNFIVKDGNNNNITIRSTDIGTDLHVPLHGRFYRDIPDVLGSLGAVGNTAVFDARNTTGIVVSLTASAVAGCNVSFEASLDSTDGTNGTWLNVMGQRSDDPSTLVSSISSINATLTYGVAFQVSGYSWFRVRCTAITSGALNVRISPCDDLVMPSRAPTSQAIVGQAAHDAAVSGSPVRVGTKAVNAMPAVVSATNDVADSVSTMQGVLLVTNDVIPTQRLRASSGLTTTSDVILFAAPAAGLRNHVTDIQLINIGAALADVIIKDGTTEIWRLPLPQNIPVTIAGLRTPLTGTAATAINVTLSVAGNVRINAQGYVAV